MTGYPGISVIVAAPRGSRGVDECLRALTQQQGHALEVLLVSPDPREDSIDIPMSDARWLHAAAELVPQLWSRGIEEARGEIVALTTSDHLPAADWLRRIRTAHIRSDAVAIGGPVAPPQEGVVSRAIWLLRYSAFALIYREQDVEDLAGDNVSYKMGVLVRYARMYRDGFWEPEIHRLLLDDGHRLHFDPEIVVRMASAPGWGRFLIQRFRHGTRFGCWRWGSFVVTTKAAALLLWYLIPVVLLAKVLRRAVRLGLGLRLLPLLPAVICFVLAWSAGEAWGYLSGLWDSVRRAVRGTADEPATRCFVPEG